MVLSRKAGSSSSQRAYVRGVWSVVLHSKDSQLSLLGPLTESRHLVVPTYPIKNFPDLGCPSENLTWLRQQGALIEHPGCLQSLEAKPSSIPLGRILERRSACLNIGDCNRVGIIQEEWLLVGRYLFRVRVLERWEFPNGWKGRLKVAIAKEKTGGRKSSWRKPGRIWLRVGWVF